MGFPWLLNETLARNVINIVYIFCTLDTFTCAKCHVRSNFLWGRSLTPRLLLIICLKLFNIDLMTFLGKILICGFGARRGPKVRFFKFYEKWNFSDLLHEVTATQNLKIDFIDFYCKIIVLGCCSAKMSAK